MARVAQIDFIILRVIIIVLPEIIGNLNKIYKKASATHAFCVWPKLWCLL